MTTFVETGPNVQVDTAEYTRLLGFPRGHRLEGRALELAEWAREWYAAHGRPWTYARRCETMTVGSDSIGIDGVAFRSRRLRRMFEQAGAHTAFLVAVSAGPEIEREAHRAWIEGKPDEYFFLEMYGSAVVEHLTTMTGARLCGWAEGKMLAVLPHDSPGYSGWDIADQPPLFSVIGRDGLPGPLDVFDSGMLRPKKSLLAVFGVTRHTERVRRLSDLVPCENCAFAGCQFRRVPYRRAAAAAAGTSPAAVQPVPAYGTNPKALQRWAAERLTLTRTDDGIDAVFRYDGTTCTSMGQSLTFHYRVTLGPLEEGYPIREQLCMPAPRDDGHRAMCEYLREGPALIEAIAREKPLLGRRLEEVLAWERPTSGPGCYCEPEARQHKWGLVLETIHYALSRGQGTAR